jgi:hypothetical protein
VTKYQISAINSCWEKWDEKWAYMFNVTKNQQSRQTGSRNLMGPKTLPTIWGSYIKLVTFRRIFLSNYWWQESDIWSQASYRYRVCHIVGNVFGPVRFLLPVCRLSWFLYTLNIYAHFFVTEKNATKNVHIQMYVKCV